MTNLLFSLIGSDRLTPVLNRAGDGAAHMARRIELAATEADLAMADLTRDLENRVRDAEGRVIPESEALGRSIGEHIRHGTDETLSALHPQIQVDADSRPADEEVAALYRRMEALRDARIGVDIPVDAAIAETNAIHAALTDLAATHADPQVRIDTGNAAFSLAMVRDQVARLDRDRATIDVDLDAARALAEAEAVHTAVRRIGDDDGPDRARGRFGLLGSAVGRVVSVLGSVGPAAMGVVKVGAIAGSAVPLVASLVSTLANMLPAAGIAVTGIMMVVSAGAALKIGMAGVSKAVTDAFNPATKAKQLQADLKGLAPNARAFVLALRGMKPEFDHLRLDVQNNLFFGLASRVRELGSTVLPVLDRHLATTGAGLNTVAQNVVTTASRLARGGVLGRALDGANAGLYNLSRLPSQIVKGFVQVGSAAAPAFAKLTASAGAGADKISDKLSKAFASGGMEKAIESAISLVGQFGHILGNVGTVVTNVLGAAGTAGANAFGLLGTVTSTLAKVTGLPVVQKALGDLFETMSEVGRVAAPLLSSALRLLAPVLSTLAPFALRLVDTLGAALQPVINALGPVLVAAAGAVGQLTDAAGPLLIVAGSMIAKLGPLLTPILTLVGQLFEDLAPVLAQLGQSLLPPFSKIVTTVGTAFTQLAPVLDKAVQQLGTQGLTPIITGLATVITGFVNQGAAQFLRLFQELLPVVPLLIPVVVQLGQSIGQILVALAPLLPQITLLGVELVSHLLPAIIPLLPPMMQMEIILLRLATGAITKVVLPAVGALITAMRSLKVALQPAIDAVTWVTSHIESAFNWLYDRLLGHSIIPDTVRGIVSWFAGLPGKAASALAGLPGAVVGRAADAGSRLISAVRRGLDGAVSWIGQLPGRARDALGNVGGILAGAGRSLISGLVGGIESGFSSVKSTLGNLTNRMTDWKGPRRKDAALFTPAGKLLIQGLIAGIDASTATLKSRLQQVTNMLSRAIDINASNRHKRSLSGLSNLVAADNRKLLTLASQRDAIAGRIAAAKKFATDTANTIRGQATLQSLGDVFASGGGQIKGGLQAKLLELRQFQHVLADLGKKGLNKNLLRQIIDMGPDAGLAYANTLDSSTTATISQINSLQSQIDKTATDIGNTAADVMYDSGKNASKGFLAGLQSQEAAIEQLMTKIAKSMQTALRRALGIRSPSTVMAGEGGHATEGVAVGVIHRLPVLHAALARVSAAVAGTPLAFAPAPAAGVPAATTRAQQTGPISITVPGIGGLVVAKELQRAFLELKRTSGLNISLEIA